MTNEQLQRTMEFIIEQQAQFASNIGKLEEERRRDATRLTNLEESFKVLVELAENTDARLDRLESSTTAMVTNISTLQTTMTTLAAAQAHADERLSTLIDIVREDRNGKLKGP